MYSSKPNVSPSGARCIFIAPIQSVFSVKVSSYLHWLYLASLESYLSSGVDPFTYCRWIVVCDSISVKILLLIHTMCFSFAVSSNSPWLYLAPLKSYLSSGVDPFTSCRWIVMWCDVYQNSSGQHIHRSDHRFMCPVLPFLPLDHL